MAFTEQGDQAKPDLVFLVDDRAADVGRESVGDTSYDFGGPHSRDYRFVMSGPHLSAIRLEGTFGSAPRYLRWIQSVVWIDEVLHGGACCARTGGVWVGHARAGGLAP